MEMFKRSSKLYTAKQGHVLGIIFVFKTEAYALSHRLINKGFIEVFYTQRLLLSQNEMP